MSTHIIRSKADLRDLVKLLGNRRLPISVTVQSGKHRTIEQNKLQRLWLNEIADQLGDQTPEEVRGFCKLTMGVPILRAEDDEFCAVYDRVIRPLPYEAKLACMMEPIDFPVTRRMNTSQKVRFLDHMHRHFSELGCVLTEPAPELARYQARYRAKADPAHGQTQGAAA